MNSMKFLALEFLLQVDKILMEIAIIHMVNHLIFLSLKKIIMDLLITL